MTYCYICYDFLALMSYEKHWLDRVDVMIRKSMQHVYVDIADIRDDITVCADRLLVGLLH